MRVVSAVSIVQCESAASCVDAFTGVDVDAALGRFAKLAAVVPACRSSPGFGIGVS